MQQQGWLTTWMALGLPVLPVEYGCASLSHLSHLCCCSPRFWTVFGLLFVFKIFPCLYSTPFSPAATSVPNSDTCSVTVLSGCFSPFSLGHLFPFCSYSPGCCFSIYLLLSLVTLSSIILLHPSFHHAASVVPGLLYGDFILKVI